MKNRMDFSRRGSWALAIVIVSALTIVGCLNTPLGNSEQSKMDAQFVGLWMNQEKSGEDQELYAAIPYDSRTYLLTQMIFHKSDGGAIQPRDRSVMKMWLTDVGGTTFMTAENADGALVTFQRVPRR